jgi:hypothetical protein
MTFEEALLARLKASAAVKAMVGDRIHWQVRPQGSPLPALVLTVASERRTQHLKASDALVETLVQADSLSLKREEAAALDAAVRAVLLRGGDEGNVKFWRGSDAGRRDLGESQENGFLYRVSRDIRVRHTA